MKKHWQKHIMMLPSIVILLIFSYVPMVGLVMAFQNYVPSNGYFGSEWTGLYWFKYMFNMGNFTSVVWNTLFISLLKIFTALLASVIVALLLNEMVSKRLKMLIQSAILFPYFVSWVVLADIVKDIVAQDGIVNQIICAMGGTEISFLTDEKWFIVLLVVTNIWKEVGYNAVIISATLATIDPALYEAADIDGASRMQKMRFITIPAISTTVAMLLILALGGVLNGGFDQIYNLYNTTVLSSADIIDTYVYRMGINRGMYSLGTAVGFFKSVIGAILLVLSYKAADKYAGYQIF
ncbi:MAG: sugar ABC transporter permease [Tyzzerella sp.]|nr:sugar ABC transporter permease [Tyzzerella sp.]